MDYARAPTLIGGHRAPAGPAFFKPRDDVPPALEGLRPFHGRSPPTRFARPAQGFSPVHAGARPSFYVPVEVSGTGMGAPRSGFLRQEQATAGIGRCLLAEMPIAGAPRFISHRRGPSAFDGPPRPTDCLARPLLPVPRLPPRPAASIRMERRGTTIRFAPVRGRPAHWRRTMGGLMAGAATKSPSADLRVEARKAGPQSLRCRLKRESIAEVSSIGRGCVG